MKKIGLSKKIGQIKKHRTNDGVVYVLPVLAQIGSNDRIMPCTVQMRETHFSVEEATCSPN